jgi:hypothetical protein
MQIAGDRLERLALQDEPDPWHALESECDQLRLLLEVSEAILWRLSLGWITQP